MKILPSILPNRFLPGSPDFDEELYLAYEIERQERIVAKLIKANKEVLKEAVDEHIELRDLAEKDLKEYRERRETWHS